MKSPTALVVIATMASLLAGESSASASPTTWYEEQPVAEQQALIDYTYDRSPVTTVPYAGAATEASELDGALAAVGETPGPAASAISRVEFQLLTRVGLVPEISAAFPEFGFVAGTFTAGWQIGTSVRKLFARLEGPPDSGLGGSWTWQRLLWYPKGYEIYFGARVQQDPGAYLYEGYYNSYTYDPARWFDSPCPFSGFTPPTGARLQTGVASTATCFTNGTFAPIAVDYPYVSRDDVGPKLPIHPYNPSVDGTPAKVSPAPADPGTPAVTSAFQTFIDSDTAAPLRSKLDWVENGASDPMSDPELIQVPYQAPPTTDYRRWCELSTPGTGYSTIDPNIDKFTTFQTFPAQTIGSADLLYGTDDELGRDGNQWDDIQGFGLRMIAAMHGWSAADETATAQTLAAPITLAGPTTGSGRYEYIGPSYAPPDPARVPAEELGTGTCHRVVVVDTTTELLEPRPRGIVTSYGKWTGAER